MSGQLILGKDVANNKYVPISVDSSGHLDIDVQVADLDSKCMVSVDGTTSGTQKQARCDTDGHLQVDILSGGGGDATAANQTTQITNQGTINTSLGTVNTSVGTVNSTLGDTNSKIDAMRGTSDLGVINTSLGTVNTSIGTSNSTLTDIEAHQGNIENNLSSIQSTVSSNKLQVDVITTALPTGAATQATLADVEAHQGNIENNLSSIQSTVSSNKLQVDVITSALPSGAATETTLAAAEAHIGTIDTSTASVAGCVSGTEVQVDVRNRTDSAPVALTFSTGNKIIAASGTTRTGTIDVGGCSSYVIMMNMLVATTNSSEFSNTDVSIEYSPDDGSTFMGSVNMSGSLEMSEPKPLYQASGTSGGTIVGYGIYIQSTNNMSSPLMGIARTNKIRIAVQNPFGSALTLDSFAIYKFN